MDTIFYDGLQMEEALEKYKEIRDMLEDNKEQFRQIQREYFREKCSLDLGKTFEMLNRKYETVAEEFALAEEKIRAVIEVYEKIEKENMQMVERLERTSEIRRKYSDVPTVITYGNLFQTNKIQHESWLVEMTETMF